MLILEVLAVPLTWRKVHGGAEFEWIGYFMDLGRFELGISASRAAWVIRWLDERVLERKACLGELREGLGRLQFAAGPLEHLRPLLGPLYAGACCGPRHARPLLPPMIMIIMTFLSGEIRKSRMSGCRERGKDAGELFRLDAKAQGEEVAIGGWRTLEGKPTKEAAWFAVRLTRKTAPWAFARGETFRVVASLELLGVLVGVMTLMPKEEWKRPWESTGLITIGCGTDNQGNSYLLDKLMTTKYPLGLILIELSHQLSLRRAALRADWVPRLQNEEADSLTNSDYRHFSPENRIEVDLEKLEFGVLDRLLEVGEAFHAEREARRDAEKVVRDAGQGPGAGKRRRAAGTSLRERDPW